MILIGVGSLNPAKIAAVRQLIDDCRLNAELIGLDVPSGVSAMPLSDNETREGAVHRAKTVLAENRETAVGIGLEGGVAMIGEEMFLCNWGALADRNGRVITAGGARIKLPRALEQGVRAGDELGTVAEQYAHEKDISKHGGTIGLLTGGLVTRTSMFVHILKLIYGEYAFDGLK